MVRFYMTYKEQYNRVMRYYNRIKTRTNDTQKEYEDDLYAFFQNCWHLKDWLKNDPNITVPDQTIEDYANNTFHLKICADLGNRTKHLKLTRKRFDADFNGNSVKAHLPIGVAYASDPPPAGSEDLTGWIEYEYYINVDNNSKLKALDVAEKAIGEWDAFFVTHNINV